MKDEAQIRAELKRIEEEMKKNKPVAIMASLGSRFWTLKWVLGESGE